MHLRYEETHPGSVYWFDPFSLNQHPVPGGTVPTKDLIAAFGDRILEFQATLIVAAPWNNPAFLDRAWYCFVLSLVSVCMHFDSFLRLMLLGFALFSFPSTLFVLRVFSFFFFFFSFACSFLQVCVWQ